MTQMLDWVASEVDSQLAHRIARASTEWPVGGISQETFSEMVEALSAAVAEIEMLRDRSLDADSLKGDRVALLALVPVLRAFAHPDLHAIKGGNYHGDESEVFVRNEAHLTIGDFRRADAALAALPPHLKEVQS